MPKKKPVRHFRKLVSDDVNVEKAAVAVIEIGENKNPTYLNGYKGGMYQVLVTTLKPDDGYAESLKKTRKIKYCFQKRRKAYRKEVPATVRLRI